MYDFYDTDGPMATEADAHREWHRNAGVPMGTPGCPQDACHPAEPDWDEDDDYREANEAFLAQWAQDDDRVETPVTDEEPF